MSAVVKSPIVHADIVAAAVAVLAHFGFDVDAETLVTTLTTIVGFSVWLYRRVSPAPKEDRGFRSASAEDTNELILRKLAEAQGGPAFDD